MKALLLGRGCAGAASSLFCEVMSWLRYGSITVLLWPLLQLPHQPEQRLCYGRHAIQERLTVSAVPKALRVFFQPLCLCLAYPASSRQQARQLASSAGSAIQPPTLGGPASGMAHSLIQLHKTVIHIRKRPWHPLQCSCLENPTDGGAWWAAVHGVAKSRTRLSDFTFTFHFHALEKEMAAHSSVLAWRIRGTGEPCGLPSMGSHRAGHN